MPARTHSIPNPLTALRLLALPLLWLFAVKDWQTALAIGLALAAVTDAFDGRLAKKYPQFTDGKFDSLADKLLTFSVILWLVMLKTQLLREHSALLLAATLVYTASLFVGWRKHGRVTALHTHLGKLGGLMQAVFVFHAFFTGGHSLLLFHIAVSLFIAAAFEELAIQLVYDDLDEEVVRSIAPYLIEHARHK